MAIAYPQHAHVLAGACPGEITGLLRSLSCCRLCRAMCPNSRDPRRMELMPIKLALPGVIG